jgi:uncharacterized phage infection (PIP) family protein YhgE
MTDEHGDTGTRVASVGGRGLGIVGIVVSIVLAIVVVLGRGWAVDKVHSVAASVDDALAKAIPLLDRADSRVATVNDRLVAVSTAAATLGTGANVPPAIAQRVSSTVAAVSEDYLSLRTGYADARARVVSAADRLQTLDAIVPFITIPQGPGDALQALDDRVQALDDRITTILQATPGLDAAAATGAAVAGRVAEAQSTLADVQARLTNVEARLQQTRADIASAADTVSTVITLLALALLLVLAYGAFLHVVLFRAATRVGTAST